MPQTGGAINRPKPKKKPLAKPITKRARGVIKTGAANVADKYDLKKKGQQRFAKTATKQISKGGKQAGAYIKAIKAADKTMTTKKEAKGAAKVLRRNVGGKPKGIPSGNRQRRKYGG